MGDEIARAAKGDLQARHLLSDATGDPEAWKAFPADVDPAPWKTPEQLWAAILSTYAGNPDYADSIRTAPGDPGYDAEIARVSELASKLVRGVLAGDRQCMPRLAIQLVYSEPRRDFAQVSAVLDGQEVGHLRWHSGPPDFFGQGEIVALGVATDYQHQGIATRMYQEARKHGPLVHSKRRTQAGDGFARKVDGEIQPLRPEGYLRRVEAPPVHPFVPA